MKEDTAASISFSSPLQIHLLSTLRGYEGPVNTVRFSPNGQYLASSGGGNILLWSRNGDEHFTLHQEIREPAANLKFSPDGTMIVFVRDNGNLPSTGHVWSHEVSRQSTLPGDVYDALFAPDGSFLALGTEHGHVRLWDMGAQALLEDFDALPDLRHSALRDPVSKLSFSPDGTRLAFRCYSKRGSVQVCTVQQQHLGKLTVAMSWVAAVVDPDAYVFDVCFSPDWQFLTVIAGDVYCFDAQSLNFIGLLKRPNAEDVFTSMAFSPYGDYVAVATMKGEVHIWDIASQNIVTSFEAHTGVWTHQAYAIGSLDWSSDGTLLATSGTSFFEAYDAQKGAHIPYKDDYTIKLWRCKWKNQKKKRK